MVNKKNVNKKANRKKVPAAAAKLEPQVVEHIGIVRFGHIRVVDTKRIFLVSVRIKGASRNKSNLFLQASD